MKPSNPNIPVKMDPSGNGGHLPSTEFRAGIPNGFEEEINLRDYLEVILRRKWLVLGVLFMTFVSALIFSLAGQKLYRATGTLEVSMETQRITKFEDVVEQRLRAQEFITTQVALIKSNAVAERVIQSLHLKDHPLVAGDGGKGGGGGLGRLKDFIATSIRSVTRGEGQSAPDAVERLLIADSLEDQRVLKFFHNNLEVSPSRDSMIINVSFISPGRQLSRDAVNRVMMEYIDWKMDQRVDASAKAREYLMKQIDRAKINLEEAEEKQHQFARQAGIVSMDSRLNSVFRQLEDITVALGQAEAELIALRARYEQAVKDGPETLPQVLNSPMINHLKTEYAKLRSEYESLTEIFYEDFPEVRTIRSRMASVEARIAEESGKIFDAIRHEYASAENQFASLQRNMQLKTRQALALNERATQYMIMAREVETNKAIYQSLLERAKEIESMAGVSPSNIQIVDVASLPIFPAKPNVRLNLMLAVILGLMAGLGTAFLVEYFADTITNPDQITERFQVPILGVLPMAATQAGHPVERMFFSDPRSTISEAMRTAKVSIQLSGANANARCIAITSTEPGEGKSMIASNLAQSFAGSGERVLLIDADLRKPSLHHVFSDGGATSDGHGLSSFLAGVVNGKFVAPTGVENLYLIPCGPIPPNPVELLSSGRFEQLLKKAAETFDRVIIDCPPYIGFADILVISRQAGGIILVAAMGEATRNGLRKFYEAMRNVNGTVLGCVINKVNLNQRYGYNSYYKYYNRGREKSCPEPGGERISRTKQMVDAQ
jgi:polysaccharide biosynthesis transport protein